MEIDKNVALVWEKAIAVPGYNPTIIRKDICGAWIKWNDYGNRESQCGWEIDHIKPVSLGGSSLMSNLRPLHWQNNARKSDGSLTCPVTASV